MIIDKTAAEIVKLVGSGVGIIFKPAAEEFAKILQDEMKYYRFKNNLKIMDNTDKELKRRSIQQSSLKSLGFGDQYLILEKASMEEKEQVQELWALLIANCVDPSKNVKPDKRILEILSSLGPEEAGFLKVMTFAVDIENRLFKPEGRKIFHEAIDKVADKHWRHFPTSDQNAAIQNLIRLRCIALRPRLENVAGVLGKLPKEIAGQSYKDWAAVDSKKFEALINELCGIIAQNSGLIPPKSPTKSQDTFWYGQSSDQIVPVNEQIVPEFAFSLTELGKQVLIACEENDLLAKYPGEE